MDKCIIPILLQLNKLDIVQKQLYTHQFWCRFLPQSSPFLVKQTKFWYILGSPKTKQLGNQVKHLLIILSLLLLTSNLFGQSERPETIVIPVGTLGDISDSRKQIIQNTLSQELTKYFRLVPQDKFEEAQEKAFEELEYEECTEDQCIMMIQELLQVENVFSLQLVEEDGDTQLSLTWVGLEEKKVLTDFCEGCKTKELNSKIELLVKNMVQQIGQVTKVETEPKEKLDDTTESYTYKLRGIIGSGSSDKTEFSNMSLHFVWDWLGIGLSDFYMKTTSSAGQKYELHNQSLDLSSHLEQEL